MKGDVPPQDFSGFWDRFESENFQLRMPCRGKQREKAIMRPDIHKQLGAIQNASEQVRAKTFIRLSFVMATISGRDVHGKIPVARADQDQRVKVVFVFKIIHH
ncbi:MAG: hypothetical protein ABSE97_06670 [Verrucomicrobiota bacterium]